MSDFWEQQGQRRNGAQARKEEEKGERKKNMMDCDVEDEGKVKRVAISEVS